MLPLLYELDRILRFWDPYTEFNFQLCKTKVYHSHLQLEHVMASYRFLLLVSDLPHTQLEGLNYRNYYAMQRYERLYTLN